MWGDELVPNMGGYGAMAPKTKSFTCNVMRYFSFLRGKVGIVFKEE